MQLSLHRVDITSNDSQVIEEATLRPATISFTPHNFTFTYDEVEDYVFDTKTLYTYSYLNCLNRRGSFLPSAQESLALLKEDHFNITRSIIKKYDTKFQNTEENCAFLWVNTLDSVSIERAWRETNLSYFLTLYYLCFQESGHLKEIEKGMQNRTDWLLDNGYV